MLFPPLRVTTIGFDILLIQNLFERVKLRGTIQCSHLVVTMKELEEFKRAGFHTSIQTLRPQSHGVLFEPDTALLASLEGPGIPTVHNMILGDRVLCTLPAERALGYLTFLARRISELLEQDRPEVVLGGFDSAHAGIGLAVCRKLGIPWLSMSFTAIPRGLMGFCAEISPDALLPLTRPIDDELKSEAERILDEFLQRQQNAHAYISPVSLLEVARRARSHVVNLGRRFQLALSGRLDEFTWPSNRRRASDYIRRVKNTALLPTVKLLHRPPEKRFAFFPLHMQPESSIDAWEPFFSDQLNLIRQIVRALPPDLSLWVKLHISDADNYSPSQLATLRALPGVELVHPTAKSREFLERADLIFGIQGTACIEAAMLGKPVLMFGRSPYLRFPSVRKVRVGPDLPAAIRAALEQHQPSRFEIVQALANYLSRYMPGLFNDWSKEIQGGDIDRVTACFERLAAFIRAGKYCAEAHNKTLPCGFRDAMPAYQDIPVSGRNG